MQSDQCGCESMVLQASIPSLFVVLFSPGVCLLAFLLVKVNGIFHRLEDG